MVTKKKSNPFKFDFRQNYVKGGRRYYYHSYETTKREAEARAKRIRRGGKNAIVIKRRLHDGKKYITRYGLFICDDKRTKYP